MSTTREPARAIGRRTAFAATVAATYAASAPLTAGRALARAAETSFPSGAAVLVAGPTGGRLDQYATAMLPALARGLPAGTQLRRDAAGATDGVTGANQFQARRDPDGASVLLMPGEATLAWLIGDPRARFDAARLVPVLAGVASGVLMSRLPPEALARGATVRLAGVRPEDPAVVGLLALELLGLRPQPAPGGVEDGAAGSTADAAFIVGPEVPQRMAALARLGLFPLLTIGAPGEAGAALRDPLLADVPTLPELALRLRGTPLSGPLYDAWRAMAAAARLTFLLALPALAPAALVALWRQVGVQAAPQILARAAEPGLRVMPCPDANLVTAPLVAADVNSLFELRRWLAERLNWQPA